MVTAVKVAVLLDRSGVPEDVRRMNSCNQVAESGLGGNGEFGASMQVSIENESSHPC